MAASPTAPTLSTTGISAPNFAQIWSYFQAQIQAIYGSDVYLGNDSQDGQLFQIFARACADADAAAIALWAAFSPTTAQGAGLSSVVAINGLTRKPGTASTAVVTITGVAGTVITNGVAGDQSGNLWSLPQTVTIPSGGSIAVTATCQTIGAIAAAPSTITVISTPTYGWQSVMNAAAATAGTTTETDAALRARQAISTELPSLTIFDGIMAAILNVPGVTRAVGYENATNSTNSNGIPARTLAFVVEGASALPIATAINSKKPPGVSTYGTTSQNVIDSYGTTRQINYSAPIESAVDLTLTITPLTNWSSSAKAVIAANLAAYLSALPIGQAVSWSMLFGVAYNIVVPYAGTFNITAITMGKNGGNQSPSDLAIGWNEAPVGSSVNVAFVGV